MAHAARQCNRHRRILVRVLAQKLPEGRRIIASDISPCVLAMAQKRLHAHAERVHLQQLDAENMPSVPDSSVDACSMSLGLKICDRQLAMREALRVLRPGGRFIVLEASHIRWPWLHRLYLRYMGLCMPALGWLATGGDASACQYLLRGVREFPDAPALAQEMQDIGFSEVRFERLTLGIVAIHVARKP